MNKIFIPSIILNDSMVQCLAWQIVYLFSIDQSGKQKKKLGQ